MIRKVLVTDYIDTPDVESKSLRGVCEIVTNADKFNPNEISAALVWHANIDTRFLDQYPNLQFIQRYGVGFDNVDIEACEKKKILFCNNPDYGVDEVSDTALAKILFLTRGLGRYKNISQSLMHDNRIWQERVIPEITRLNQQKLLVIGAGRIGTALILKARALFNEVTFFDPFVRSGHEKSLGCKRSFELYSAIKDADIVSLNCNLDNTTRGIVDTKFIESCQPHVLIVNTARGGLFESDELVLQALNDGKIGGLATDVLNAEPPKRDVARLIERIYSENKKELLITNHTAYYSRQSIVEMRKNAAENIKRFVLDGKYLNYVGS